MSTATVAPTLDLTPVLTRLAELGPPSEVRAHAPAVAAQALDIDRVLLSAVDGGVLVAEALHVGGEGGRRAPLLLETLREHPVLLEYPLLEGELVRRRRAEVIRTTREGQRAFAEVMGWTEYVAAPVILDGRVIGFFHADRARGVDEADAIALASYAACFALVYERAVLRHRLRVQRHEMRQVASWADARTSELGDRSIGLDEGAAPAEHAAASVRTSGVGENALRDLLTRRELEVLQLIVRGETNAGIARDLVVSEGTVKFHVKNILRKLHAANRAEATSRYLRLTLRAGD